MVESVALTVCLINAVEPAPLKPLPSEIAILAAVPCIVLVAIVLALVLEINPVVVIPAIGARSPSYGIAEEPSTVPSRP